MSVIWFDVDTALSEVAVNAAPIVDAATAATIKTDLAYNASGLALFWHFVTPAGAHTVTAVTPTSGGAYDWAAQSTSGIYTIEIPASAGASINNDTEGFGYFTGVATGYLPWRSPTYGFRAAALNDALIEGGDNLDVNTVQWLGTACATPTVAGVPEVDVTHNGGTAITAASGVQEVKVASIAANAITAAATATDFGAEIADAVWDEAVDGTTTARHSMALQNSALAGEVTGLGTTTVTFRDLADSKDRIIATVDGDGNRTAFSTRDGS